MVNWSRELPTVGSSKNKISGLCKSVIAKLVRLNWPPLHQKKKLNKSYIKQIK